MKKKLCSYFSLWRKCKILKIMKISALLMVTFTLNISAIGFGQFSFTSEGKTVREIFDIIEKESNYRFFYNDQFEFVNMPVDLEVKNRDINQVLDKILAPTDYKYKIFENNLIVISLKDNVREKTDIQQNVVKGTITDEKGAPVAGATVIVKGTTTGKTTDLNGNYVIENVTPQTVLLVSFIGYKTQEITIGDRAQVNIVLQEDVTALDEVVVVGYGTVKKKDITGAVASVKAEDLMATNPTTIQKALTGKTAGVLVTSGNLVNSTPTIRIRGNRSVNAGANDPLFVIDGIISTGGMETINPSDVESMEILKDASATAIYGSRGANGVILVTTKKGQAGKVIVEYDGYYSVGTMNRFRKAFNAEEYADLVRDAARTYTYDGNGGYALSATSPYGYTEPNYNADINTTYLSSSWDPYIGESVKQAWAGGVYDPSNLREFNWQMSGFRDYSSSQNHAISIRGGSESTKVFVSGSYLNAQDLQLQSFRKRYTLRLNLDQNLGKRMAMGGNINFSYLDWNGGKGIPIFWSPLGTPWYSPNNDITLTGDPAYGIIPHPCGEPLQTNSFYDLEGVVRQNKNNRLLTNLYMTINLFKGLSYRANFGSNLNINQEQGFNSHYSTVTALGNPNSYQNLRFDRSWTFENILSYNTTINSHAISATFVQTSEKSIAEPVTASGISQPIEDQLWYALGSASTQSATSGYTQWTMMSWLGRVNYTFKDKYLLTGSLRYDGSSRLAEGNKWVAFPSAAVAWRVSDEGFMKGVSVINNLKLRLGYGVTGNSSVSPYGTVGAITSSRYNWDKTTGAMGYAPSTLSNPNLSWEKTSQYNIGIDFGLFKGRLSGAIELYQQNTSDLLMYRALPTVSGFPGITQNIGETRNQGIELNLSAVIIAGSKFNWTADVTFSKNKEEITKLATGLPQDLVNNWFVGYPIDTYYNYVAAPVVWGYSKEDMAEMAKFNANGSNFKPGDLRLVDLSGDYKITDVDRQIRGSKMPKVNMSLANTFRYGPFDLYVFMYGAAGQTIYWDPGIGIGARSNTYVNDYWTPTRTDTKWLAPHTDIQMPSNINAMFYWEGDYLKISDITLGYTLPKNLLQKMVIQNIRVYAKVQDPFMFTKFEGNDPEGAIAQTRSGGTINSYGDAPFTMRTFMFGLNVTF
jgi:TonB-linked SusC/RagA family outer membrane protein